MRTKLQHDKRIIIKVGTSTLIYPSGEINLQVIDQLAFTLSALRNQQKEVILVSSGAIGVGMKKLNLDARPATISQQQAVAAVGQTELMNIYNQRFSTYGQQIGQVLLTRDVIDFPESRKNTVHTLNQLLDMNIIPIINENDSVSVDELDHLTKFGDNDQLSSIVAQLVHADLLIMLSDIDGFYSANPNTCPDAKLFAEINEINDELFQLTTEHGSRFGTGGMSSKLKAAKRILESNASMVLANGKNPEIIFDIINGKEIGTFFTKK